MIIFTWLWSLIVSDDTSGILLSLATIGRSINEQLLFISESRTRLSASSNTSYINKINMDMNK
jgi:hypothetical protein